MNFKILLELCQQQGKRALFERLVDLDIPARKQVQFAIEGKIKDENELLPPVHAVLQDFNGALRHLVQFWTDDKREFVSGCRLDYDEEEELSEDEEERAMLLRYWLLNRMIPRMADIENHLMQFDPHLVPRARLSWFLNDLHDLILAKEKWKWGVYVLDFSQVSPLDVNRALARIKLHDRENVWQKLI